MPDDEIRSRIVEAVQDAARSQSFSERVECSRRLFELVVAVRDEAVAAARSRHSSAGGKAAASHMTAAQRKARAKAEARWRNVDA